MHALSRQREELSSLSERLGVLSALRAVMVLTVLMAARLAPNVARAEGRRLVPVVVAYVAVETATEVIRRVRGGPGLAAIGAMLLVDGAFVAGALYMTGGPTSDLRFLVELHLIAVTLLVSYRTGVTLAGWYTTLFLVGHVLHGAGFLPDDRPGQAVVAGFGRAEVFGILAFWLVAVATTAFSSLNERELRRSKVHLRALVGLSAALTEDLRPERVPGLLLDAVLSTFPVRRGAVVVASGDGAIVTAGQAGTPAEEPVVRGGWPDELARRAGERRAALMVRSLGPRDPVLRRALPRARNVIVVPMVADGALLGVLAVERGGRLALPTPARTVDMLGQFAAQAGMALRTATLHAEVRRLATTDPLTGLDNRRVFDESVGRELARSVRSGRPVAVALFDVDHFKVINDTHGHQAGDEVLRRVGAAVRGVARAGDVAARFGGEEFVLLLPGCDPDRAVRVAERVRAAIAGAGGALAVTASAGVAAAVGGPPSALIRAADQALYQAKRSGRDRTVLARGARRPDATADRGHPAVPAGPRTAG